MEHLNIPATQNQENRAHPCKLDGTPDAQRPGAAAKAALYALRIYKSYFSLLFAGSCRFTPTCSRYAYEAIERFGVRRGSLLAMKRLLRCQPLSRKFGYDPVPETWEDMHSTKFEAVDSQEQHSSQPEVRS